MEQRRLRLGDILDDYCPRERRITNHAVVAMIEEDVKQTRCTTCDAEHAYKGGQAPRKRKKDSTATLYKEVLSGMTDNPVPVANDPTPSEAPEQMLSAEDTAHAEHDLSEAEAAPPPEFDSEPAGATVVDEGPVHRPLIRATLPRPEGQKDSRPVPEFTVRHPGNRGNGQFRDGRMRQRAGGARVQGGQRFASPRGNGRGPAGRTGGFRGVQNQRHGGKKRSR
jgi:hypothetical protein